MSNYPDGFTPWYTHHADDGPVGENEIMAALEERIWEELHEGSEMVQQWLSQQVELSALGVYALRNWSDDDHLRVLRDRLRDDYRQYRIELALNSDEWAEIADELASEKS